MQTIQRITNSFLLFLIILNCTAQQKNNQIDSLIQLITEQSYRAHFDSLRTDEFCNRKVISSMIQSSDHDKCRNYIYNQFQLYLGRENVYLHKFESNDYRGLANVIGFKKGKDKNAGIWIIGAHYDSNNNKEISHASKISSPGANDNGTGLAAILELARITSKLETRASILFAAWDLEEVFTNGKATGSNTWFNKFIIREKTTNWATIAKGGIINKNDLTANLNFDMFGNPHLEKEKKPILWVCYATNNDIAFVENYVSVVNTYISEITAKSFGKLIYSDHYTFSSRKIPSVENLESDYRQDTFYHTYGDNLQNPHNINMKFATNVTRGGLAFLLENIWYKKGNQHMPKFHKATVVYAESPNKYYIKFSSVNATVKFVNCYGCKQEYIKHNGYLSFSPRSTGLYFIQINRNNQNESGILNLDQKRKPIIDRPFH